MATGRSGLAGRGGGFCTVLVLAALLVLFAAQRARADLEFCPQGTGAGQCAKPIGLNSLRGLAIDHETGHLYVADKNNNRVDVFEEGGGFLFAFGWKVNAGTPEEKLQTCTTASGCQAGSAGSGAGQFNHPTKVAVDNGGASPHAVYVDDEPNLRVEKFSSTGEFVWMVGKEVDKTSSANLCTKASGHTCGVGIEGVTEGAFKETISVGAGPAGALYVLDNLPQPANKFKQRLQRFEASGAPGPPQCILREGALAVALAVDESGNSWVTDEGSGEALRKYDSSCAKLLEPAEDIGVDSSALAIDEAGDVFVVQNETRLKALAGLYQLITAHKPNGELLSRFAYGRIPPDKPEGLAARSGGEGGVFVAQGDENGVGRVVVKRLNFAPATPPPHAPLPPPGPIAAPPGLEAKGIGSTKATLVTEINPEGKETQVHFEYLTQAEYEAQGNSFSGAATKSKPTLPESLGAAGFKLKAFERQIGCPNPAVEASEPGKCLTPETTYRWRVVATNADGGGEGTVEGAPFTTKKSLEIGETYATEVGTDTARLHAEVNPLSIPATGFFEYVDDQHFQESGFAEASKAPDVDEGQAPLDFGAGEALATRSIAVFPLEPGTTYHYRIVADDPLIEPIPGEAKTLRTFKPAGVEPCENEASRIGAGALLPDCRAYELVSPLDKAGGDIRVLKNSLGLPAVLEQSADSGEKLAYGSYRSFGDAQSAPYTSQYIARRIAGKEWETHSIDPPRESPIVGAIGQLETEFKAFSGDLCNAWLATFAEPPLAAGGVAGFSNLYRYRDSLCGTAGYEALAPIVTPASEEFSSPRLEGLSADGSRAIFIYGHKLVPEGSEGQRQLYESVGGGAPPRLVCILPGGAAVSGTCGAGSAAVSETLPEPLYGAISKDGQRIFWSTPGAGEGKLYVRIGGTQTEAVSKAAEEATGTSKSWFWGAAGDGSEAIFTTGNLDEGKGRLYDFGVDGETTSLLAEGVSGVMGMSTDGKRIYFTSGKVLAAGASAGNANLYLYEAGAGGGTFFIGTLASADLTEDVSTESYLDRTARVSPDGAHAAFLSVAPLTGYDNTGATSGLATRELYRYDAGTKKLVCASCNPSGARPAGAASIPSFKTPIHGARVLSDDGRRLYFESADRLVARDTDGKIDVYQWEEVGAGGCDEVDAGFSAAAEGCIELISSGQGSLDSRFVESDPSGNNVFFVTLSSLLPQDYGLADVYDARVGGGLPIPPPKPPACEGDACQNPPAPPEAPTPAGETYAGPPEEPPPAGQGSEGKAKGVKGVCARAGHRAAKGKKAKPRCAPKHKRQRRHRRAAR